MSSSLQRCQLSNFNHRMNFNHHVMEAYLMASLTRFVGMQTPEQAPPSAGTGIIFQWLTDQARDFVEQVVAVPRDHIELLRADQIFNRHRCYLHASLLYHDLRNAIRCEDGLIVLLPNGDAIGSTNCTSISMLLSIRLSSMSIRANG